MSPLITIVIPIYKVEQFIERCLQSVVNQTYTNIECILVNDVTPDSSMEIAERFIQRNPEFKFIVFKENLHKQKELIEHQILHYFFADSF